MILSLSKNKEMDTSENDQFSLERRTSDHLNHQSSGVIPTGWLFGAPSMNMESDCPIAVGSVIPMNSSPCSSVPMVDPFIPMASNENNILRNINSVNCAPFVKSVMSSRGMFLPTIPKILTPSLSHYPADSSFIGRAAMFSCTGGNFSGMINSFDPSQTVAPCTNISKDVIGTRLQNITLHMSEAKDVSLPLNHESRSGSPIKNQINKGSSLLGVPNNDAYETNFTEGSQETNTNSADASGDSCPSDLGAKKRKRIDQYKEMVDQVQRGPSSSLNSTKESTEAKQQVELTSSKPIGKHVKDGSEVPKEDHIHVRARRGQATNSHSIAERLRRERISERMKYLQDLVPGCSKVTGKAVMLDEIINYVQSLQQQVEFLSMKLAAVTPQHNYSIEGLLAKDLHSCDGTLSVSGLPQEMIYPQLRPSQQDSLDAYRRLVNSHWTTMHNSWGEELNVMKMTNGTNPPINAPESSKPCDDFPM